MVKRRFGARFRLIALVLMVAVASCATVPVMAHSEPEGPQISGEVSMLGEGEFHGPDSSQITSAYEAAARREEERTEELESPAATQERTESRDAYINLTATEAEALLRAKFSAQLEALNSDPARYLSDANVDKPLGEGDAIVTSEGKTQLLEGSVPIETKNGEGELEQVDVGLEPTPEGFVTENPLVEVSIAPSAEGGVELGGEAPGEEPISITQAGAEGSEGRLFGDKNVFFNEVEPESQTDLLVSPTASGVEFFDLLRSAESPEEFRFKLELSEGSSIHVNAGGGADVVAADGSELYEVPRPTATDAQGSRIPATLEVENDVVVVRIPHTEREIAYPALLDPEFREVEDGWDWYDNQGLNGRYAWHYSQSAEGNGIWGGFSDEEWKGVNGLFIAAQTGYLAPNIWGQWIYEPRNVYTYVAKGVVNRLWRGSGCSLSQDPYDYTGTYLYNEDGTEVAGRWVGEPHVNDGYWYGNSTINSWGNEFVVGLGNSVGKSATCWHNEMNGGSQIWLEDWNSPTIGAPSGQPSGWVNGTTPIAISAEATDKGLGVQSMTINPRGEAQLPITIGPGCTGTYEHPCPSNWVGNFNVTGKLFAQGETYPQLSSEDPTLKGSSTQEFPMKVDRAGPEISLSGQLAKVTKEELSFGEKEHPQGEGNDELNLPVYNLIVKAKDGALTNATTRRSGVKKLEVLIEGTKVGEASNSSCSGSSCELEAKFPVKLTGLSAAKHKLKVIATDFVENKEEREIEFEYVPATGLSEEFVLQRFPLPDGKNHEGEEVNHGPELAVNVMNGNLVYHQRDVDVAGPNANLEVELFYNSQLPKEQSGEWGRGWTLSQTPKLEKTASGSGTDKGTALSSESAIKGGVQLPQEVGQSHYSAKLNALVTKQGSGGYSLSNESGHEETTTVFNASGKATEEKVSPYAKVKYEYASGKLSEIAVNDPAATTTPPPPVTPAPSGAPAFLSSFGSSGTGNGQFSHPADVAIDPKGNLWVADQENNRLEEFTANGEFLKTLGSKGSGNGQFSRPKSIAFTVSGSFWVADSGNNRLEQFNEKGEFVKAVGSVGSGNGQFNGPEGIAIDTKGNIWVSDTYNYRIQELNSAGEFVKVVNPPGLGAIEPTGIDVGPGGNVWVADWTNNRVAVLSEGGEFVRSFGARGSGNGQFDNPDAITIDSKGDVWVGDQSNGRIQEFNQSGEYLAQFGTKGSGPGQFSFSYPVGMATDNKGNLWIADTNNNRVQRWQLPSYPPVYLSSFGSTGTGSGQFKHPGDVAVDPEGNLWVPDTENNRIEKFNAKGEWLATFGSIGSGNGQFRSPKSIAFTPDGDFWVADAGNNRLQEFTEGGKFTKAVGSAGSGNGQFNGPESIAIDAKGNIWVSDTYNYRVQELNEAGEFIKVVNPPGLGAIEPTGLAIGPGGSAWVSDWAHDRVVELSGSGEFVRSFGAAGTGNGQFAQPDEVAVDNHGIVWVGDQNNGRIQGFSQSGEYVGQFGAPGTGAGQFSFGYPMGIAVDGKGSLWVADSKNNRIQRWLTGYRPTVEEPVPVKDDPAVSVHTTSGFVSSIEGPQAGHHTYGHEGELLVSDEGPEGTTHFEYDTFGRLTKVSLPNETKAEIKYDTMGRATKVTVDPAGAEPAKSTNFAYTEEAKTESRETIVEPEGQRRTFYAIGADGSVLRWWNSELAPTFVEEFGSLAEDKEKELTPGDQSLTIKGHDAEGIAKIQFIANGNTIVDEKTCTTSRTACEYEQLQWITNTEELPAGTMWIEAVLTDWENQTASKRWWVNVPFTPPPPSETPQPPKFAEVMKFREEHGLDLDLNPVVNEIELHERVVEMLGAWHNPQTPLGEVARASWERWGVPLRPVDVAELEYRERYIAHDLPLIEQWGQEHASGTFAGVYVDEAAGGRMRLGFTGSGEGGTRLSELKAGVPLVAPERAGLYVNQPQASLSALDSLGEQVDAAQEEFPAGSIISESVDVQANRVVVRSANVPEATTALTARFGSTAPFTIVPEEGSSEEVAQYYNSTGTVHAGDYISTPKGECSAGFGAFKPLAQGRRAYFMLTAAHCASVGQTVTRRALQGPEDVIGSVNRSGRSRPSGLVADVDAVFVSSRDLDSPMTINGDGIVGRVKGFSAIPKKSSGAELCHSGAGLYDRGMLGVDCGKITSGPERIFNEHIQQPEYWTCFSAKVAKGDSGGPVWINGTNIGVGMAIDGRGRIGPGLFKETCVVSLFASVKIPKNGAALSNEEIELQPRAYEP